LSLQVGANADVLTEPMLFYLSAALRGGGSGGAKPARPTHRAGLRDVTRVKLVSPHADRLSPELSAVTGAGLVQMHPGPEYFVELGFDGESEGQQADFRPLLPLVFYW
jgi:hypothetical protein